MSKECFNTCPRIEAILKEIRRAIIVSDLSLLHQDTLGGENTGAQRLLKACKDTYVVLGQDKKKLQQKGVCYEEERLLNNKQFAVYQALRNYPIV